MARTATTADVYNALGDATRREILDALAEGEATVGTLVGRLHLAQPQVSKHLGVLRQVDLVRARDAGRHRLYRVHRPALVPLQAWLTRLTATIDAQYDRLDDHLAALQATDRPTPTKER